MTKMIVAFLSSVNAPKKRDIRLAAGTYYLPDVSQQGLAP